MFQLYKVICSQMVYYGTQLHNVHLYLGYLMSVGPCSYE